MGLYNKICFLRHLKTRNNNLQIITGQSDSEIIEVDYLKVDLSMFDKIYCSPSLRCVNTIRLLSDNPYLINNVIYDKRLNERNMGYLEGMKKKVCRHKYPNLFYKGAYDVFKTPPKGESYKCFKDRVKEFYDKQLCNDNDLKILVCSHNQTLKLLRLLVLKKEVTYQSWSEYSFKNGKISEVKKY